MDRECEQVGQGHMREASVERGCVEHHMTGTDRILSGKAMPFMTILFLGQERYLLVGIRSREQGERQVYRAQSAGLKT